MRVFVCEYLTGGGMRGEALTSQLLTEGLMIRDALVRDLRELPGVEVLLGRDDRLPAVRDVEDVAVRAGDDPAAVWRAAAARADLAWPIAPETGRLLIDMAASLAATGTPLLACDAATLEIATSKKATGDHLAAAGLDTIATWRAGEVPPDLAGPVVSKPDDGAGAVDTRVWPSLAAMPPLKGGYVVQPLVEGHAMSLIMIADGGRADLLCVNRQHVGIDDQGALVFAGVRVGVVPPDATFRAIADKVAAALPGLHGIVGIDLVLTSDGPVVVEVNPRLTTGYTAVAEAIGHNPLLLLRPFRAAAPPVRGPLTAVEVMI